MNLIKSDASNESKLTAQELFAKGLELFQKGQGHEAEIFFTQSLALDPDHLDALNLAGICAFQRQDYENALCLLHQANTINSQSPYTHNTLGLIYQDLQCHTEALNHFDLALGLQANLPEVHNNRGNALKSLSQSQKAIESYKKALELRPEYTEAHNNLGVTLQELGKLEDALACFERAIQLNHNYAEAFNNAGNTFQQANNYQMAIECYEKALQINPNYVDAYINCGNTFKASKEFDRALDCYKKVIQVESRSSLAHYLMGEVYYEIGNARAAQLSYQTAIEIKPDFPEARFAFAVAQIPKVFTSNDSIEQTRKRFKEELDSLEQWLPTSKAIKGFTGIGGHQPFYLAYQELDNKDLIARYSNLGTTILKFWQKDRGMIYQPSPNKGRIHLGIVSAHFSNHPVWHAITKGLLVNIDKAKFEIHLFDLGKSEDDETALAKKNGASYTCGRHDLKQWSRNILEMNIEILLFPEIGMDPLTREIASLRLAPIQIASWGHPETTGLKTIDYFLSAENLEPENAQQNYSEKLVLLPNLGTYFEPSNIQASNLNLKELGINGAIPILLCPGSPSKYSPENDYVFTEIAKKLKKCQFIFFDFQKHLTNILKERLEQKFQNEGLVINEYVKFIPFLDKESFCSLMQQSDLYLDTIGFSGFNTAIQAIECDLPIVTMDGEFMRGRLASGLLKRIGLNPLIAKSKDEYITFAIELACNKEKIKQIKAQIKVNKNFLFADMIPVQAFESFLLTRCN